MRANEAFKDCIAFAVPHKSLGEVVGGRRKRQKIEESVVMEAYARHSGRPEGWEVDDHQGAAKLV